MSAMNSIPPGLPVQEIWDEILDLLARARDLKACALASHAFTPRAQSHLFHGIILAQMMSPLATTTVQPAAVYSRFLTARLTSRDTSDVSAFRFPLISSVAWVACGCHDPSFTTLDLAHDLIALPSVRSVHINVQRWPFEKAGPGSASRVMVRLFQNSTSHITNLKVTSLGLGESHVPEDPVAPELGITTPPNRAAIKSLRIESSPEIGQYLVHPGCLFNLSQLEDTQVSRSLTLAITQVLERARLTIKRLEYDLKSGLRLEGFPFLVHLTMTGDGVRLPTIAPSTISKAGGNCIETVVIEIQGDNTEDWKAEISLDDFAERVGGWDKRDMLAVYFPKLHERGVLQIFACAAGA
ncbi:hypothetical protein B0H17DRAFT_1214352 [Mycena rosella]|uniref:Uncharacterized protein n=1 Tax=Mycena rosella TaxID=1033263 RepID=A0AAD7CN94_MYCRO|nr:hypothetical protein B0H17DRAFT_1214352 [Mycena rosella]